MKNRVLAIALVMLFIVGFIPEVKAAELINRTTTAEESDSYDTYDITFESNGTSYIKKSELQIIDGRMKVVTTFSNGSMIAVNGITVNGKKADSVIHEVVNKELVIETVINSLDDEINFDMTITVPIISMVRPVNLYIKNIKLTDNTYDLDVESNGASYIKNNALRVQDGEMTLVTTFNMGSMITINSTTVNDEEVTPQVTSGDSNTLIVETDINSLEDYINMNLKVVIIPNIMVKTVDLYLKNLRLPGVDIIEDSGEEEVPGEEETPDEEVPDENTPEEDIPAEDEDDTNNNILADGNYTIESKFIKTGTTEESAASGYIEKISSLKVEDGQYYLTLDIKEAKVLTNLGAVIDGKDTDVSLDENADGTGSLTFKINSLKSDILIKCRINVAEINFVLDTTFNVELDKSTLKDENGEDVEGPDEDIEIPTYKDAVYTVENTISGVAADSAILGVISPKNTITVEDGKIYLTVSFYKSGFMDGRIITLNDDTIAARYSIEEDTSNKVTVKINISSIKDKIRFSSKNVKSLDESFTLLLLKDTLKEQTTSSDNSGSGSGGSSSDSDDDDDDDDSDSDLDDGTYVIKNKVLKENSNSESYAREYVDKESILTVKNDKIYLTLKFTHGKMMSSTSIKVNDKKTTFTTVKKSGNDYHIKFKIGDLDDEILVTTTIDTGVASVGKQEGVKFRVLLRESTLDDYDEDEDDDDDDDEDEDDDDTTSSGSSSTGSTTGTGSGTISGNLNNSTTVPGNTVNNTAASESQGVVYKRDTYSIANEIVTDSTIGYQAARGAIEETSYMQVEDGKKYMIINFGSTDGMTNIRFAIGNQSVNYDILKQENDKMSVRVEVPDESTEINVTAAIPAIGRDISFGLKFKESTLTFIGTEESSTSDDSINGSGSGSGSSSILNNLLVSGTGEAGGTSASGSSKNNGGSSSSSDGSSASELEGSAEENIEAKEYYKKYTIENEIVSDSMMGRTMARKYLNTVSTIDEIDGQLYVTLTFNGTDAMDNFVFTVNGENREYSVVNDADNDLKAFKFKIDSINDTIDVAIFIKPVKMNISFGVKLNESTMVLIDEGEISSSSSEQANEEFLEKSLAVHQGNTSKSNNELSLFKIAIVTSVMTTSMNVVVGGIIYLLVKRKKKVKSVKKAKVQAE